MTGTSQLDRRAIFIAQLRRTPEFQILNVLITDIHISPAQTVEVIVGRTETLKVDGTGLGNHFYTTACIILELAGKTTFENQAKLVAVVLGLHQITLLDPTTGEPLKYDGDVVWRELPTFGYTFVDEICAYSKTSIFEFSTDLVLTPSQTLYLPITPPRNRQPGRSLQAFLHNSPRARTPGMYILMPPVGPSRRSETLLDHTTDLKARTSMRSGLRVYGSSMLPRGCGATLSMMRKRIGAGRSGKGGSRAWLG